MPEADKIRALLEFDTTKVFPELDKTRVREGVADADDVGDDVMAAAAAADDRSGTVTGLRFSFRPNPFSKSCSLSASTADYRITKDHFNFTFMDKRTFDCDNVYVS